MESYPIILLPDSLEIARTLLPPLPPFKGVCPIEPGKTPRRVNYWVTAIAAAITLLLLPTKIGFFLGLSGLGLYLSSAWGSYRSRLQRHRQSIEDYRWKLAEYNKKKAKYEQEIELLHRSERIAAYQINAMWQAIKQTIPPDDRGILLMPNRSESEFAQALRQSFPNQIRVGVKLNLPNSSEPRIPAFAYIDGRSGLHIGIEIDDEVYSITPAHQHNVFLLAKGWVVVRFCQKQVVQQPESCCKVLAQVIANLVGDDSYLKNLAAVKDLLAVPQWTSAIAAQRKSKQEARPRLSHQLSIALR